VWVRIHTKTILDERIKIAYNTWAQDILTDYGWHFPEPDRISAKSYGTRTIGRLCVYTQEEIDDAG